MKELLEVLEVARRMVGNRSSSWAGRYGYPLLVEAWGRAGLPLSREGLSALLAAPVKEEAR